MLSLARPFSKFPAQITFPLQSQQNHAQSLQLTPLRSNNTHNISNQTEDGGGPVPPDTAVAQQSPPVAVEIRFRRGSRRRRKQLEDGDADGQPLKTKAAAAPKDWDNMTPAEKAMNLYMGEKGLLFWLNKFAYASIFIMIGGWLVFRFVGPALNLYQLDTPPLSPSSIFNGS